MFSHVSKAPSPTLFPIVLGALLALTACSKNLTKEAGCQEKWNKVAPKIAKGKYNPQTKESLNEIVTTCPGSPFTEQAMFELGQADLHLEAWEEAETDFNSFLKEFPNSKKYGELARYRSAQAASKQVEGPARDQTKTQEAIISWENYIDEFPDSPRADSARGQIDSLKAILAQKQMMIAHLYSRMDEPQAAAIYYKEVLKEYGGRVNEREVNLKLAECYIRMGQFDEAESYLSKFDGIAKDDPFRGKVKQAYKDLEKARAKYAREKKEEQEQSKRQEAM